MFQRVECPDAATCGGGDSNETRAAWHAAWRALLNVNNDNDDDDDVHIYGISLAPAPHEEETPRFTNLCAQFHRVGLCALVTMYRPTRDTSTHVKKPGERGCWQSHRACAARVTADRALMFEDDIRFRSGFTPAALARIADDMRLLPPSWDTVALTTSHVYWGFPVTPSTRLWRMHFNCTAAYVASAATCARLAATPYEKHRMAIDKYYKKYADTYAVVPMPISCGGFVSNIQSHRFERYEDTYWVMCSYLMGFGFFTSLAAMVVAAIVICIVLIARSSSSMRPLKQGKTFTS